MRKAMYNDSADVFYKLSGVVLHRGSAEGGHYTSVVNINGKWICFDDTEVKAMTDAVFEKQAFGGENGGGRGGQVCAYLVFYVREGASFVVNDRPFDYSTVSDMTRYVKHDARLKITVTESEFGRMQAAFAPALADFVATLRDPILLLKYFIHVFCHSRGKNTKIETALIDLVAKRDVGTENLFTVIEEHKHGIELIMFNCGRSAIVYSLISVVESILARVAVDLSWHFVEFFMSELPVAFTKGWRQLPGFAKLIEIFLAIGEPQRKCAIEHNMSDTLLSLLYTFYENRASKVLLQNVNLSSVFTSLSLLIDSGAPNSLENLVPLSTLITQSSEHETEFRSLMNKC